jgi:hypothetical protein
MTEIDQDARAYWAVLNGPADGWGQHCHPRYGASHNMLRLMRQKHGEAAFDAALDRTRSVAVQS